MRYRAAGLVLVGLSIVGVFAGGCSLLLDWEPGNQQKCDATVCDPGYSCLGTRCIRNHSVPEGEECLYGVQCDGGLNCVEFICRRPCTAFLDANTKCPEGTFCLPTAVEDVEFAWVGGCVPSHDCSVDDDCGSPREICVRITSTATACLPGCSITWTASSDLASGWAYSDSCPRAPSGAGASDAEKDSQLCQPIGFMQENQRLVCRATKLAGAQPAGQSCRPVDDPCKDGSKTVPGNVGYLCHQNICRQYCRPSSDASAAACAGTAEPSVCCPMQLGNQSSYGVCLASCE